MKTLRIVFMGTPGFAVASLEALWQSSHQVVGVVTAPDRPAGRGRQLQQSEVKVKALEYGLPVLQPEKLRDENFLNALRALNADLFVVVAFRMLPEEVWNMPPLGSVNLHASLLPQYRGAAPIQRAIMNGEKRTGVTTFFLQHEIDTGRIIMQQEVEIGENETGGELHDKLMKLGAAVMVRSTELIATGNCEGMPQSQLISDSTALHPAPKIFRDDCRIDWNKPLEEVHNHVRALSPYPAAWTEMQGRVFKIYSGTKSFGEPATPGSVQSDGKTYLRVACADGWYHLLELQPEGKRKMSVEEYLRGANRN